jgi:hypothetical protein
VEKETGMYASAKGLKRVLFGILAVLGLAAAAGATIVLEDDYETMGEPIMLTQPVVLGAPASIALRTTLGGNPGADVTATAPINDDMPETTQLVIEAGAGSVRLAPVGNETPVAGVTVASAAQVDLADVTAGGAGVNVNAGGGGIALNGNIVTNGAAIVLQGNVVLGAAAAVTLDTTAAGGMGANITIIGTVNDDVANTSGLILKAGNAGNVSLQGAVGGAVSIASLSVTSANKVDLPAVTTGGAVTVTAATVNVNGPMSTGGGAVALNAGTVSLKAPIATFGGALTGTASTVNVSAAASLQNAVDIAAQDATLSIAGGTYNEAVTVATALTMNFLDDTIIGQTLTINNNVDLGGAAKHLAVDALNINTSEVTLDVNSLPVYVDGDVEATLDDWITDGRLASSAWGSNIRATYNAALERTEVTPEPATLCMLALGGLGVLLRRKGK